MGLPAFHSRTLILNRYIIYNPQGGTEGHSQGYSTNLCLGLSQNGIEVELVTSRDYDDTEVTASGVKVSYTSITDSRKITVSHGSWLAKLRYGLFIIKNNLRSFRLLSKQLKACPFEACLIIGGDTLTNIFYLLCSYWRRKGSFALTIHNADYVTSLYRDDKVKLVYKLLSKLFLKILIRTRVVLFVHGEAMQEALAQQLGVSKQRINIYKVPAASVSHEKRSDQTSPQKPIQLLFCGVVRHDKGFDLLCEALSKCKPLSEWRVRIAGSARQVGESYVREMSAQHGIMGNCSFELKYLSEEEIKAEFLNADVVVLPYRRGFIAQSVVLTDSIRWGRPVIVSEHSQNGYDAKKYNLGWVFTSEDVASLESALKSAIQHCKGDHSVQFGFTGFMEDHAPVAIGKSIVRAMSHQSISK